MKKIIELGGTLKLKESNNKNLVIFNQQHRMTLKPKMVEKLFYYLKQYLDNGSIYK